MAERNIVDPLVGKTLGGCRVERELGRGGMGAVFAGARLESGERVAIKVMTRAFGENEEVVRRFEREADVAGQIKHPNVARVMASGVEGDVRYLVMEYVAGRPLSAILREKGRLAGPTALNVILQTARGLEAAHAIGAIHRDVKPENLMIADDGTVKIVDFGLARQENADSFKTATGAVMGTPHYMSPEQAMGRPTDHRSDIYSLGATFYHLLAGRPPFDGENAFDIVQKHVQNEVRAVTVWNGEVPEGVCQIIYRMLRKRPDERFLTYTHLIKSLEDAIEGRDRPSMTMDVVDERGGDEEESDRLRDRRRWIAIGVAAFLLAVGALGIALRPGAAKARSGSDGAGFDPNSTQLDYRTQVIPMLIDVNKALREQDDELANFENRRARNNETPPPN